MGEPINHHFLPRVYMKGFKDGELKIRTIYIDQNRYPQKDYFILLDRKADTRTDKAKENGAINNLYDIETEGYLGKIYDRWFGDEVNYKDKKAYFKKIFQFNQNITDNKDVIKKIVSFFVRNPFRKDNLKNPNYFKMSKEDFETEVEKYTKMFLEDVNGIPWLRSLIRYKIEDSNELITCDFPFAVFFENDKNIVQQHINRILLSKLQQQNTELFHENSMIMFFPLDKKTLLIGTVFGLDDMELKDTDIINLNINSNTINAMLLLEYQKTIFLKKELCHSGYNPRLYISNDKNLELCYNHILRIVGMSDIAKPH